MLTVMLRMTHSGKGEGLGWRGVRRCGMLDVMGGRGTSKKHGRVSEGPLRLWEWSHKR